MNLLLTAFRGSSAEYLIKGSSLETGFNCEYLKRLLSQNGIMAKLSQNAGTSYCNSIYWNGMSYLAEHSLHTKMVFLHVLFRKNIGAMEESLKSILTERLHTLLPESRFIRMDRKGEGRGDICDLYGLKNFS